MASVVKKDSRPGCKPRLVILGGGAIGSVLAAALAAKPGLEPLLVGRRDHVRVIRAQGLRVDGLLDAPVSLAASEAIDSPLDHTLLIVTVKAVDLESGARQPGTLFAVYDGGAAAAERLRHQGTRLESPARPGRAEQ